MLILTDAGSVPLRVPCGAALPGDAGHALRAGQDWSTQRRHQLWAEPGSDPGAVGEAVGPLQAGAGASVAQ